MSWCGSARRKFLKAGALAGAAAGLAPVSGAMMADSRVEVRDNARREGGSDSGADSGLPDPFRARRRDEVRAFELDEMTIAELQDGMKSGKFTARSIAEKYPSRINDVVDSGPAGDAVIETQSGCAWRLPMRSTRSARPRARAGRCTESRC